MLELLQAIVNDPQGHAVLDQRIISLREQPVLHVTDVVYQRGPSR